MKIDYRCKKEEIPCGATKIHLETSDLETSDDVKSFLNTLKFGMKPFIPKRFLDNMFNLIKK